MINLLLELKHMQYEKVHKHIENQVNYLIWDDLEEELVFDPRIYVKSPKIINTIIWLDISYLTKGR